MNIEHASQEQLRLWEHQLAADYAAIVARKLNLDLTRGKPSAEQLSLSDDLDGILKGNYKSLDGTDTRNYGGGEGLPEARALGAAILDASPSETLALGNSSLTLMFQCLLNAVQFGFDGPDSAWHKRGKMTFICPTPGYDRHFTLCEQLGIQMIAVDMGPEGPNMDQVEQLIDQDPSICGMWCVPKYANPTGVTYSDAVVDRMAKLAKRAQPGFRIFWDNAYAVHDLAEPQTLASIMAACNIAGTQDSVIQFASTSKITHAGAGVAFVAMSARNLTSFKTFLNSQSIGPDKVNQLRHMRLLPDMAHLRNHMQAHARILQPRFDAVSSALDAAFTGTDLGQWETPKGGYFVSFDTQPGCAQLVVQMAAEAGVKLTPAGATFPYGKDPQDRNIRIAPSVPSVAEVIAAMEVFVTCVKLASVRRKLAA
ncbi:aminotransferase class I/II-fold pyridoxal phosphate-dependent enzyme [Simiduia aestuariiviva]|uniref:DNA-binding transcriptional MocR family regulator n=1 Tax=Simiduia aestuariiviva TaxID=1510459 RepID=A0A839UUM9_9GAMM|nr:aminotransferase class I/II-fold pyridoxal phosphate-dependent enzyme [Simiduia aestuariiviva]MBB3169198.1 DNA-binding transcriptional MocR family regulator [Simiduia aestuariiviva]